jgi:hypothetical protein
MNVALREHCTFENEIFRCGKIYYSNKQTTPTVLNGELKNQFVPTLGAICGVVSIFKGPNRVRVSLPSPEDGNGSSFRSVPSLLEYQMMVKVQKPGNSESHTRTSEPFTAPVYPMFMFHTEQLARGSVLQKQTNSVALTERPPLDEI